jgi:hypothetical protein
MSMSCHSPLSLLHALSPIITPYLCPTILFPSLCPTCHTWKKIVFLFYCDGDIPVNTIAGRPRQRSSFWGLGLTNIPIGVLCQEKWGARRVAWGGGGGVGGGCEPRSLASQLRMMCCLVGQSIVVAWPKQVGTELPHPKLEHTRPVSLTSCMYHISRYYLW